MEEFVKKLNEIISWVDEDVSDDTETSLLTGKETSMGSVPTEGIDHEIIELAKTILPDDHTEEELIVTVASIAEYVYDKQEQEEMTPEEFFELHTRPEING